MKYFAKSILIQAPANKVFAYMDNLSQTGMHMMQSSSMMMGSKLNIEQLSENATGLNSKYHWFGKMIGLKLDFTVVTTKWIEGKEKVWETTGKTKMIILDWYQMKLLLTTDAENTRTELSIQYTLPENLFLRAIAFILAPIYAKWCVNNMLTDSKRALEI